MHLGINNILICNVAMVILEERDSEIESSANKIVDNCLLINNDGKCDETDTHTSDKSGDTKIVTSSVQVYIYFFLFILRFNLEL